MTVRSRALVCRRLAPDFAGVELAEVDPGPPGAGEAVVRVRAAALNFPDVLMTRGEYQLRPPLPFVLGLEAAGEVEAAGPGAAARPGDRVCVLVRTGAFAERVRLPAADLRPLPAGFDFAEGAAFQVGALTAWVALVPRAGLRAGETLLVHGASGGMGLAAVRLGRRLGATVVATGRSRDKLAVAAAHGAHHVVELAGGFRDRVRELTGGRGADVVFDPVGGDVFDESLRAAAWGGRVLVVGFAAGRIPVVPANQVLLKGVSIVGVRAGEYGRRDPAAGAEALREIDRLAAEGVFRPHVGARFPLERGVEALRALARAAVAGKIVLDVAGGEAAVSGRNR